MELIERYIYAVSKRLPHKQKKDIELELRGLIEDMLMERSGTGKPKTEDVNAVLLELGEPARLADKYRETKQYLIGPEYFDTYLLILKIVLASVAFGITLALTISYSFNPPIDIFGALFDILFAVLAAGFQAFTWVTLIFALSERLGKNKIQFAEKSTWKPTELPQIPVKEAMIGPFEALFGIIMGVIFLVVFTFSNQFIGAFIFEQGKFMTVIPIFSESGLVKMFPFIFLFFGLGILKECIKLIIGKWTLALGIGNALLNLGLLFCAFWVFSHPLVWNTSFVEQLNASMGAGPDAMEGFRTLWNSLTKGFVYLIAFGLILDSLVSLFKAIKYRLSV